MATPVTSLELSGATRLQRVERLQGLGDEALRRHAVKAANEDPEIVDQVLLNRGLQVARGKDVIVDRVTLPPNTVLPKRWHPGEMFVYVIDGSVILSPNGQGDVLGTKGEVVEVPFRQVYSARTDNEGAQLLIFRVHVANQPVRVMVD